MVSFEHFARAIQCNPLHSHAYVEWGIAERRSGDSEKFIKFISHAITINPNCTKALFERGVFYSRAARAGGGEGFFDMALDDFNQIIEFSPRNKYAYLYRAEVKEDMGDVIGAAEDQRVYDSFVS